MKQSEIIKAQLQGEDNDLKALGISTKIIREERSERFEDTWPHPHLDADGDWKPKEE
jgi:hypothetical protein